MKKIFEHVQLRREGCRTAERDQFVAQGRFYVGFSVLELLNFCTNCMSKYCLIVRDFTGGSTGRHSGHRLEKHSFAIPDFNIFSPNLAKQVFYPNNISHQCEPNTHANEP